MVNLLKMFGKGILYIIGFPFFVLALIIFGAIGIFLFLFQLIKSIFYFFSGRQFFPELPEDKELRIMKMKAAAGTSEEAQSEPEEKPAANNDAGIIVTPVAESAAPVQEAPAKPVNTEPLNLEKALFIDLSDDVLSLRPDAEPAEGQVEQEQAEDEPVSLTREEAPAPKAEEPVVEKPKRDTTQDEAVINSIREALGNNPNMQPKVVETAVESKEPEPKEDLEEYVPAGSNYYDESEEEDTGSGVHIDYDL